LHAEVKRLPDKYRIPVVLCYNAQLEPDDEQRTRAQFMHIIHAITKVIYGLFGVFFVLVGGSVLLLNTGLLPEAVRNIIVDHANGDGRLLHVLQEWGNVHLLLGLLTFWFIRHYDQSQTYHWAMTAYFAVNALIHWFNVAGPPESLASPLINTIPFILFVTLGLLRSMQARADATATRALSTSEARGKNA
jgi:hypothetical protein